MSENKVLRKIFLLMNDENKIILKRNFVICTVHLILSAVLIKKEGIGKICSMHVEIRSACKL